MRRVIKLEGRAQNGSAPATFTLPDGHYQVPTGDGGMIRINVSHGQAGIGINIVGPGHDSLRAHILGMSKRTPARDIDIAYYSPIDAYAQAFSHWYDASGTDDALPYPGTRAEFESARIDVRA